MAGVALNYRFDVAQPINAFHALERADRGALLSEIGEQVLTWTLWNFDAEKTPEGEKWKPSERALGIGDKNKPGGKTLQDKGHLRDSYTYALSLTAESVEIGSNMIYAAIHHFGGKAGRKQSVTLPPRPALGLTEANERDIGEKALDFYRDVMMRGAGL